MPDGDICRKILCIMTSLVILGTSSLPVYATVGSPGAPDGDALRPINHPNTPENLSPQDFSAEFREAYKLGTGDELNIIDPSLKQGGLPYASSATVLTDGTITIYPVGVVDAAGLTIRELTERVNELAKRFIRKPGIVITLAKSRPISFYVLGAVTNPGLYGQGGDTKSNPGPVGSGPGFAAPGPLAGRSGAGASAATQAGQPALPALPQSSAAQLPVPTVLTALQMASGLLPIADVRRIRLTRHSTGKVYEINLWELLVQGDSEQDRALAPGDVIFVPRGTRSYDGKFLGAASDKIRPVRILGAVANPGVYYLGPNDDVYSAIASAGGFAEKAATGSVLLSRLNPDGTVFTKKLKLRRDLKERDTVARAPVMPGDVIYADKSLVKLAAPGVTKTSIALGALGIALILLYASRNIKNRSIPQNTNSSQITFPQQVLF